MMAMWTASRHRAGLSRRPPAPLRAGRRPLPAPRVRRSLAAAAGPPAIAWAAYSIHPQPAFLASVTWERFLLQSAVPLMIVLACALAEVWRHLSGDWSTAQPVPVPAYKKPSSYSE